jgi:hypothetical protein
MENMKEIGIWYYPLPGKWNDKEILRHDQEINQDEEMKYDREKMMDKKFEENLQRKIL